ncbi:MAG: AAA family ATPase [Balneolaceae bacterium]
MMNYYPDWAQQFARKYLSRTLSQFILHGNVHDLVPIEQNKPPKFMRLKSFLSEEFFGSRDFVVFYDRSSGIWFRDQKTRSDFNRAVAGKDSLMGTDHAEKIPKDPVRAFSVLEQYFRLRLEQRKSIALIIDYADTIVPVNEGGASGTEDRNALVTLLRWAHDPLFLASDFTTVLLTENLSDLNKTLIQHPQNTDIRIPIPDESQRLSFIQTEMSTSGFKKHSRVQAGVLAQQTAGLNFIHLRNILANAKENRAPVTFDKLSRIKKELIEAEAYGLMEFVESDRTLEAVAGHTKVKEHLRQAVRALKAGRQDVIPMGYLICGPVGTGKTFLVNCFAGEVGIPIVKLKNFRSQWQGVTEGNLEKILNLLKAMAPVTVMIDEADATLGNRALSGDSGVSSRVFSQIATFMSDTSNRGRVIWFLMTARPDLMPVDLKRQGRAEEHLALFAPSTREERIELFEAMKKKTGLKLTESYIPKAIENGTKSLSGADMEAALTRAKFRAASGDKVKVTPAILDQTLEDFIPPTYPEEVEFQVLSAVMECTSKSLLPEKYRDLDRAEIMERMEELR